MKKFLFFLATISICLASCDVAPAPQPTSASGVAKASVKVTTDLSGHTTEQNNIMDRYKMDNMPGSIKHLYIISAMTGQTLIYSTVRGKVTSSGKRLTPTTVSTNQPNTLAADGMDIVINGTNYKTGEVLQDDGTYGSSAEYIYWFDSRGIYHQQYITGGMIVHVSSQPLTVKGVIINMEENK